MAEVTDRDGKSWPFQFAIARMDPDIKACIRLAQKYPQRYFDAYCSLHERKFQRVFVPTEYDVGGIFKYEGKPIHTMESFIDVMRGAVEITNIPLADLKELLHRMPGNELTQLKRAFNDVTKVMSTFERTELPQMTMDDLNALLDDEQECNGLKAALSLGSYLLQHQGLAEEMRSVVLHWLRDCVEDIFKGVTNEIQNRYQCNFRVEPVFDKEGWRLVTVYMDADSRWMPLNISPVDATVAAGMLLGAIAVKGLAKTILVDQLRPFMEPLPELDIAVGVAARGMRRFSQSEVM